ncbi:MAG: rubrerythrin family protein [Rikenellaceae bacterium]
METKSLKGTKTEANLLKAFAGESQARNRYGFYAKVARKEGYQVIAKYFEETAENERQHAKLFFAFLEGGMVEITASYPAGITSTTAENLRAAAGGENEEWSELYPEFARIAEEEGFPAVAAKFTNIAAIEKAHEERFTALLNTVEAQTVFNKAEELTWRCRECGHEHFGTEAPEMCPVCAHPQAYFEIKSDEF